MATLLSWRIKEWFMGGTPLNVAVSRRYVEDGFCL